MYTDSEDNFNYAKTDKNLQILTISNELNSFQETMYVIAGNGLNLRAEPTTQSKIICTIPFLTKVKIIDKNDELIKIDGISSQWYKIKVDNITGWIFGGYLSNIFDIPKVNGKNFVAVYRIKNIDIDTESFGFEDIAERLKKSYLVIYETTGNKRYIYDDEGLIEIVPRIGEGGFHGGYKYEIIITGVYTQPWKETLDDNRELTETILITFQSSQSDSANKEIIYYYNILVTYEKIDFPSDSVVKEPGTAKENGFGCKG
jgi:hypothetical protein